MSRGQSFKALPTKSCLELNPRADLNRPRPVERLCQREAVRIGRDLRRDRAEVERILQIRSGIVEVGVVENVEEVERERKAHTLAELCLFSKRKIELPV